MIEVHWVNPWASKLPGDESLSSDWIALPVPIEELVDCVHGIGESWSDSSGPNFIMTRERMLEHWGQCGRDKLDAYIIPHSGIFSIGVRYGNDGDEYYSPYGDKDKVQALYNKYKGMVDKICNADHTILYDEEDTEKFVKEH